MTTAYTDVFRLNKPDFRVSPWSALLNDNADRIDELLYNILQAANMVTFANDLAVDAGTVVYDTLETSFWIARVSHTTPASGTFADARDDDPENWAAISLGLSVRGQWQNDAFYSVNDLVYDASQGLTGYCNTAHTSNHAGSMRTDILKFDIIFDSDNGGSIAATAVAYDDTVAPYTAANVQVAIDEANDLIEENAADIDTNTTAIASHTTSLSTLNTTVSGHTTTLASHTTTLAGLGTASTHADSDYATAAQGTLATNALPKGGGTATGVITGPGFTATTSMTTYGYSGLTTKGITYYNQATTAYLLWDASKFNFSHLVYGSNGRLWGASDFASVPPQATTSMRWIYAGQAAGGYGTEVGSPYMLSGAGWNGSDILLTIRYLQYYINGTWYTVGFA